MAEFTADLQSFRPSFPVLDIEPNMESLSVLTTSDMDFQSFMSFSNDRFFGHQAPEFAGNLVENFPGAGYQFNQNVVPVADQPANVAAGDEFHDSRKRKAMDDNDKPENSSGTSSPPVSESGSRRKNVMICSVSFFFSFSFFVLFYDPGIRASLRLNPETPCKAPHSHRSRVFAHELEPYTLCFTMHEI